jgi:hypothetical protein
VLPKLAGAIEQAEEEHVMAYSARILALIQRIEAADAVHFTRLRERAKQESDTRAKAREKILEKKREILRVARAARASADAKKKLRRSE